MSLFDSFVQSGLPAMLDGVKDTKEGNKQEQFSERAQPVDKTTVDNANLSASMSGGMGLSKPVMIGIGLAGVALLIFLTKR